MFKLKPRDFLKGFLLTVMTSVLTVVQNSIMAGIVKFDWQNIGMVATSTAIAYLLKNFLTDDVKVAEKIIIEDKIATVQEQVKTNMENAEKKDI